MSKTIENKTQFSPGHLLRHIGIVALCLLTIGVIGLIDWWLGRQLSLAPLAVVAVAFATISSGRTAGLLIAILSAVFFLYIDRLQFRDRDFLVTTWNMFIRLLAYLLISYLLAGLRRAMKRADSLARTDSLTGLANRLHFDELLQLHIQLSQRHSHPISLAYLDLDHFKEVNDRWGHYTGNKLLRLFAGSMRSSLRNTDVLARLGGDEFAILLPETDEKEARLAIERCIISMQELMEEHTWPVTVSIGLATYISAPASPSILITHADALMYKAKAQGRNQVCHEVSTG